jgi:multimeric flavodoxin WrbA
MVSLKKILYYIQERERRRNLKILVIHGSPRRKNTWNILNLVKSEMSKHAEIEFKDIELVKEEIPLCCGCFSCFYKGESSCPHNEKVTHIARKIKMLNYSFNLCD